MSMLSYRERIKYERTPPELGSVLDVPGHARLCCRWLWAMAIVARVTLLLGFRKFSTVEDFYEAGSNHRWLQSAFYGYWLSATNVYVRSAIYVCIAWHMAIRQHASKLRHAFSSRWSEEEPACSASRALWFGVRLLGPKWPENGERRL